jgi:Sec-independent protein secretion pathway component TatC
MDKRALFFLVAAFVCAVLTPATPGEYRWFAAGLAVLYVVLALASWLDNQSRKQEAPDPN